MPYVRWSLHGAVTSRRTATPRTGTSAGRALGVTLIESLYIVFILPLPLLLALILDEEHSAFEILATLTSSSPAKTGRKSAQDL